MQRLVGKIRDVGSGAKGKKPYFDAGLTDPTASTERLIGPPSITSQDQDVPSPTLETQSITIKTVSIALGLNDLYCLEGKQLRALETTYHHVYTVKVEAIELYVPSGSPQATFEIPFRVRLAALGEKYRIEVGFNPATWEPEIQLSEEPVPALVVGHNSSWSRIIPTFALLPADRRRAKENKRDGKRSFIVVEVKYYAFDEETREPVIRVETRKVELEGNEPDPENSFELDTQTGSACMQFGLPIQETVRNTPLGGQILQMLVEEQREYLLDSQNTFPPSTRPVKPLNVPVELDFGESAPLNPMMFDFKLKRMGDEGRFVVYLLEMVERREPQNGSARKKCGAQINRLRFEGEKQMVEDANLKFTKSDWWRHQKANWEASLGISTLQNGVSTRKEYRVRLGKVLDIFTLALKTLACRAPSSHESSLLAKNNFI
ncbi:hypothetical protein BJ508DRAFT_334399 [Ascobolus immersus RN42]|uniref:Uncharacterized protein n=1 Tax=Ascobolus immersus RN42 TaxID=1160509 RepID=A0A3N4HM12_ASCIM|nr:hypothetical protein BJ508DRAFT_334399 [Ascobolus immersus RN42]